MRFTLFHGAITGMGSVALIIGIEMWYRPFQEYVDGLYPHFFATIIIALIESMIVVGIYQIVKKRENENKGNNETHSNQSNFLNELTKKRLLIVLGVIISSMILGYLAPTNDNAETQVQNTSLGKTQNDVACLKINNPPPFVLYPIRYPPNSSLLTAIDSVNIKLNTTEVFVGDSVSFHTYIDSGTVFPNSDNQILLSLTNNPNDEVSCRAIGNRGCAEMIIPDSTDTIIVTQYTVIGDHFPISQQNAIYLDHAGVFSDKPFESDGLMQFPVETTVYISGGILEPGKGITQLSPQKLFTVYPANIKPQLCR